MLGWPRRNHVDFNEEEDEDNDDPEREEVAKILVETVCECTAAEKAVLLCLGLDKFPSLDDRVSGFVDVWWVVHDGGLLLMIAHLLLRHRTWERLQASCAYGASVCAGSSGGATWPTKSAE